jgi:hypothetical protein
VTTEPTDDTIRDLALTWIAEDQAFKLDQDASLEAWEQVGEWCRQRREVAWRTILLLVELAPDDNSLGAVAAGPLESLIRHNARAFVDRIEARANQDPRFRRCLGGALGFSGVPADLVRRLLAVGWMEDGK